MIINANSPSRTDVGNAVASASDGDEIIIPSGTAAWSTLLTINKAITLRGAGTVILDGNGRAINAGTVIQDSMASGSLISMSLVANKITRLENLKFASGSRTAATSEGLIQVNGVNGDNRRFVGGYLVFDHVGPEAFAPHTVIGVIHHCTITSDHQVPVAYVKCESWNGSQGVDTYGDGAYSDADNFGTDQFLFFEDCNFICDWIGHVTMVDGSYGCRYVVRHSTIVQGSLENHGAESDRGRSGRAMECYNNVFSGNDGGSSVLFSRGGTWIVHDNAATNYNAGSLNLLNDRSREPLFAPIGPSDGRNPWDKNNAGNPFDTGTVTTGTAVGVSGVSFTMSAAAKSWTPNQWQGYTIRRTSGKAVSSLTFSGFVATANCVGHGFSVGDHVSLFGANQYDWNYRNTVATVPDADHFTFVKNWASVSPATGTIFACKGAWFAEIFSNTSTQITYNDSFYYSVSPFDFHMQLSPGDAFEINKVDSSMDQVGIGSGSNLNGIGVPALPSGWPNQVASPNYEWNNTADGVNLDFTTSANGGPHRIIQEGVHYFNDTPKPGYIPFTYPHPLINNPPGLPVAAITTMNVDTLTLV